MDTWAGQLTLEYLAKACRTDQKYCGTAPGDTGPVETKLGTMGSVEGIVVGAFGEGFRCLSLPHPPPGHLKGKSSWATAWKEGAGEEGGSRDSHHH